MEEFKYPLYRLFFDIDEVPCTFLDDMIKQFPEYEKSFNAVCWEIERLEPVKETFYVLALQDVLDLVYGDVCDGRERE